jgi:uncharacterized protein YdeI (YjbR/CyaY-like superfamily)
MITLTAKLSTAAEDLNYESIYYRVFHKLTPGKQRGLLYKINKPKGAETRVKAAIQISEYLKSVDGKLDYKELNAYIKADNENWKGLR